MRYYEGCIVSAVLVRCIITTAAILRCFDHNEPSNMWRTSKLESAAQKWVVNDVVLSVYSVILQYSQCIASAKLLKYPDSVALPRYVVDNVLVGCAAGEEVLRGVVRLSVM